MSDATTVDVPVEAKVKSPKKGKKAAPPVVEPRIFTTTEAATHLGYKTPATFLSAARKAGILPHVAKRGRDGFRWSETSLEPLNDAHEA